MKINLSPLLFVLFAAVAVAESAESTSAACTLEAYKKPGQSCLVCNAWSGDSAKCLKYLRPKGYEQQCRGEDTKSWSEVWCKPDAKAR